MILKNLKSPEIAESSKWKWKRSTDVTSKRNSDKTRRSRTTENTHVKVIT